MNIRIDTAVRRLRRAVQVFHYDMCAPLVLKSDVLLLCDEVKRLERDLELATQDWRE